MKRAIDRIFDLYEQMNFTPSPQPMYSYVDMTFIYDNPTQRSKTDENHFIRIIAPGWKKEEVDVRYSPSSKFLTVKRKSPIDVKKDNIYSVMVDGDYESVFSVDDGVHDVDGITIDLSYGILKITIPLKKESEKSKEEKIYSF